MLFTYIHLSYSAVEKRAEPRRFYVDLYSVRSYMSSHESNCDKSSERKFEYLLMFKYEVLYMKFFYDTLFLLSDNVNFLVERKDQTFPATWNKP